LFASLLSLASQPFAPFPSQLSKPTEHVLTAQLPDMQVAVAFARLQAVPHLLQFFVSVFRFTSQPSLGLLLQSP